MLRRAFFGKLFAGAAGLAGFGAASKRVLARNRETKRDVLHKWAREHQMLPSFDGEQNRETVSPIETVEEYWKRKYGYDPDETPMVYGEHKPEIDAWLTNPNEHPVFAHLPMWTDFSRVGQWAIVRMSQGRGHYIVLTKGEQEEVTSLLEYRDAMNSSDILTWGEADSIYRQALKILLCADQATEHVSAGDGRRWDYEYRRVDGPSTLEWNSRYSYQEKYDPPGRPPELKRSLYTSPGWYAEHGGPDE